MPEEIEVPTEHLHEKMEEEAHHAGGGRNWISRVAVSSAILAVVAAITALLASHHADEAILKEMKATDQWSYFQAKGIKRAVLEGNLDLLASEGKAIPPEKQKKLEEYAKEMKEIEERGHELDEESEAHMRHHVWFARGVTLFQIGIAMGAIAVLAKRPKLWWVSLVLGAFGGVGMILGFLGI